MSRRLSWVVAAPFLAIAALSCVVYTAAVWAADTLADLDTDDPFPEQ